MPEAVNWDPVLDVLAAAHVGYIQAVLRLDDRAYDYEKQDPLYLVHDEALTRWRRRNYPHQPARRRRAI